MVIDRLQSHHGLAKRFGIDEAECLSLIDAIDKRKRIASAVPSVVGLIVAWGWILFFGRGNDALEETRWDLLSLFRDLGLLGFVLQILLGLGAPIVLALVHLEWSRNRRRPETSGAYGRQ